MGPFPQNIFQSRARHLISWLGIMFPWLWKRDNVSTSETCMPRWIRQNWAFGSSRSDSRRAAHNCELFLCDIRAKFGNVQKLTMVHKDYKTDRIREGLWRRMVSTFRLSWTCGRVQTFLHVWAPGIPRQSRIGACAEEGNYLQDDCIESNFDEARDSEINRGVKSFPRPVFEHKVMMTPTMGVKFEALQQAYEDVASCRCYESETVWLT
jgi:hypothetical protein